MSTDSYGQGTSYTQGENVADWCQAARRNRSGLTDCYCCSTNGELWSDVRRLRSFLPYVQIIMEISARVRSSSIDDRVGLWNHHHLGHCLKQQPHFHP